MSQWNGLDFFIFLIFFLNTMLGMSRGASKEIISMMCMSAALIFTIRFTVPLAAWLNSSPIAADVVSNRYLQNFMHSIGLPNISMDNLIGLNYSLSLMICFAGVFCATEATLTFTGFVENFSFPWAVWSRKVGAALGCTRGYVLVLILLSILIRTFGIGVLAGSWFGGVFQSSVIRMDSLVSGQQVDQYQQIYQDRNLYNSQDVIRTVPTPTVPASMPGEGTAGVSGVSQ